MSAEAKNLEAIENALRHHDRPGGCPYPVIEIRMSPFEVDRLGWDDYKGIPIVADERMGSGRIRLVCDPEVEGQSVEQTDAVAAPV